MTTATSAIRVDIVSDVVCPWCAIGYYQLAKATLETGIDIDVHWHPFELNPQMAIEGENLREHLATKYGTTPEGSRQARERLTGLGAVLGFTFDFADEMRMWNTFQAHQLIDWAEDQGKGNEAKLALLSAYFTCRENVSDRQILANIAEQIGLVREQAQIMLESGDREKVVREKQNFWINNGIQGVPAMVFDQQHLLTGAQGEENYARALQQLKAAKED